MFGRQQTTVDYEIWKGVRVPKTLSRHGNDWKDTFVQMVMHVLGYRAISAPDLDQNNEAVSDIAIRHAHRFFHMGIAYQTAIAHMKSKEDVMSRAIDEADRLEMEWGGRL